MSHAYLRLCDLVTEAGKIVIGVAMAAIVFITISAVWWRYVLNDPIAWIEQVSNMLFIWMIFIGSAILYRQMLHICVDFALAWLPEPLKKPYFWLVEALNMLFVVLLFWFSLKLAIDVLPQTSGALDITPAWFYFSAPVSAAMMILYFFEKMIDPSKRVPHGHAGDF